MTLSNPFLLSVDPLVSRAFRGSFEPHIGFVKQNSWDGYSIPVWTMVQPLCIRMLALHRGGLPNGNLGFPLDAKCGFLSVRISRVSVACSVCLLWAWERSPWQLLLVAFDIFKIRRLTCHCVITISAVLFQFGSKQRGVVDLPSMGIQSYSQALAGMIPSDMAISCYKGWCSGTCSGSANVYV